MFCLKCGTSLEEGAAFCSNCGAKQIQDNREEQESVQEYGKETTSFERTDLELDAEAVKKKEEGYDEDVYALLKENMDRCLAIKSVKQGKKGVRLCGKIYNHSVKVTTGHVVQTGKRLMLAFPFSILYGLLAGLVCVIIGLLLQDFIKYESICIEYYHMILFALCSLFAGAVLLMHSCVGRKERDAVETYVHEILDSRRFYIYTSKKRAVMSKISGVVAVFMILAGIIILPFNLPVHLEYPDELLCEGLPVTRFFEMTREDIELEYGKPDGTGKNAITADDYDVYGGYININHVVYSRATGKVIYIELFDCSYNRKDLMNKNVERVLDILEGEYRINPMRIPLGTYGSIHSAFYYADGVYFGDDLDAEEWLAQQEFENSYGYDLRSRFYPVHANVKRKDEGTDLIIITADMSYEIDLITGWSNELYSVCIYTDEWVERMNGTSVSNNNSTTANYAADYVGTL